MASSMPTLSDSVDTGGVRSRSQRRPGLQHQPLSLPQQPHLLRPPVRSGAVSVARSHSDSRLRSPSSSSPATLGLEGRSYVGVLRRISCMLSSAGPQAGATGSSGSTDLLDMRQHWLPDSVSRECYDCCDKFTTFRRRHHCRICGQIFCSRCCNQMIPGRVLGCSGDLRVCTYCSKVVMTYVHSIVEEMDSGIDLDLKKVLERVKAHLETASQLGEDHFSSMSRVARTRKKNSICGELPALRRVGTGSQESFADPMEIEQDLTYLTTLVHMIINPIQGVGLDSHRHRLKSYQSCLVGSEIVDWMVSQRKVTKRSQAVAIGQRLVEVLLLNCVSHNIGVFKDEYYLYRPTTLAMRLPIIAKPPEETDAIEEPHWLSQIELKEGSATLITDELVPDLPGTPDLGSLYNLQLDLTSNAVSLSRSHGPLSSTVDGQMALQPSSDLVVDTPAQYLESPSSDGDSRRRSADDKCAVAFESLESSLLSQLLDSAGLPAKWYEPILSMSRQISRLVKPDVRHELDDQDIRRFVKMKRIPGGRPVDSSIVHGVVFSHNIVHSQMRSQITNPQILLINCPIAYQRYQDRLTSLEPMLMQEKEVLKNITNLLVSFAPDLIVVEKHVESLAREMLLKAGVTLVSNTKRQVLMRIARCTQAGVMGCVDAQIAQPSLGICHQFYTKQFTMEGGSKKTLMFFDGCPSHLGCTVLLRGGHMNQLRRVKQVLNFMISVEYNWLLLRSLFRDLVAVPPSFGSRILLNDDASDSSSTQPRSCSEERFSHKAEHVLGDDGVENKPDVDSCSMACPSSPKLPFIPELKLPDSRSNRSESDSMGDMAVHPSSPSPRLSTEIVTDKSDPLQSEHPAEIEEGPVVSSKLKVAALPESGHFRSLLGDTILCCIPYARVGIPFLESEDGKHSCSRRFFSQNLYWSVEFDKTERSRRSLIRKAHIDNKDTSPKFVQHGFMSCNFAKEAALGEDHTQRLLTDFRAGGCRLPRTEPVVANPVNGLKEGPEEWVAPCDCLSPLNHQRLPVQTYIYCKLPNGDSIACSDPQIAFIVFNGDQDMALGSYLETDCFSDSFQCVRKLCGLPAEAHVQRFLHDGGCVSRYHRCLTEPCPDERIWMWTRCNRCDCSSAARPISEDTWTLSLGKYLEAFFLCDQYLSADGCSHNLFRDRSHFFALGVKVAMFSHASIKLNDVVLPPSHISVKMGSLMQLRLTEELRAVSEGLQLFSNVIEKLLSMKSLCSDATCLEILRVSLADVEEEKSSFRSLLGSIEDMVAPLVSDVQPDPLLDEDSVFIIMDRSVLAKRVIANFARKWRTRISELAKAMKSVPKPKHDEVQISTDRDKETRKSSEAKPTAEEDCSGNEHGKMPDSSVADTTAVTEETDKAPSSKVKSITAGGIKALKSLGWNSSDLNGKLISPLAANEHHRLPPTDPPTFIAGEDMGSIISYCMLTPEYASKLAEVQEQLNQQQRQSEEAIKCSTVPAEEPAATPRRGLARLRHISEASTVANQSESSGNSDRAEMVDKSEKNLTQFHIDINMSDESANFYCQVMLAEHFRRLREVICPDGEERFIRSLMQCRPWNAKGGKSGSTFQKSCDDRFVIKTINRVEKDHFVRFALKYVDYVLDTLSNGRPSALAKIIGVFLVGYKNNVTGTARKAYVIVMENLFYDRQVSQKFDLKGSLRNRMADTKDKSEVVLMDQNIVSVLSENPLYVRPHAKRVLMEALSRDTYFLQSCQVMDYSLLVGADDGRRCMVVGIIDYLRSYTYDKAMETYIKSYNILLGDGNNRPTVLDPVRYKTRFLDMMNKYFTDVPDRWLGFAQGVGVC